MSERLEPILSEYLKEMTGWPEVLNMSQEQEHLLREQLEASHGIGRVLVHPLYRVKDEDVSTVDTGGTDESDRFRKHYLERLNKYFSGLKRTFEECAKKQVPLFLFETWEDLEKTHTYFKDDLKDVPVYFVFTFPDISAPALEGTWGNQNREGLEPRHIDDTRGVVSILRDWGLKKAVVAGSYVAFGTKGDAADNRGEHDPIPLRASQKKKGPEALGCVGGLANIMHQEGIETQISDIVREPIWQSKNDEWASDGKGGRRIPGKKYID